MRGRRINDGASRGRFAHAFGRVVVKLRKKRALGQVELAKQLRISQPTLSRLERGKLIPKVDVLRRLVRTLHIGIDELYATVEAHEAALTVLES